jgi:hypothetical protein
MSSEAMATNYRDMFDMPLTAARPSMLSVITTWCIACRAPRAVKPRPLSLLKAAYVS